MKAAWIIIGLVAAYLAGQLLIVWRSRKTGLPRPPPGGWKKYDDDEEEDDWPGDGRSG